MVVKTQNLSAPQKPHNNQWGGETESLNLTFQGQKGVGFHTWANS